MKQSEQNKKKRSETIKALYSAGKKMGFRAKVPIGELNVNWKGDQVGYTALHEWITRILGAPNKCEHCGTLVAKKYEWANISKKYKREKSDWIRLCTSCHRIYDGHGIKAAAKRYGYSL